MRAKSYFFTICFCFLNTAHAVTLDDVRKAHERKEYSQAMRLSLQLAQQGVAQAEYWVGKMYLDGEGVTVDVKKSFAWFEAAANHGDVNGKLAYARMYRNGLGTRRNFPEAMRWFSEAATAENADGAFELATMYAAGEGTLQDYGEAIRWYQRAAQKQHPLAMFQLGLLLAEGKGTPKNLQEAHYFLGIAQTRGIAKAAKAVNEVEKQMSQREISVARKRLESLKRPINSN